MRKILLATTALGLLAAPALAADNDSILITAFVPEACNVSITNPTMSLSPTGAVSAPEAFSYDCNFGGEGADATLTFSSGFGGVSSDGGVTDHVYNITPSTGPAGTSAAPLVNTVAIAAPNTPVGGTFTLSLVTPINVAGTYTDTMTITIAP